MAAKANLLVIGQGAIDVVQTEFDELLTADHGARPAASAVPESDPDGRGEPRGRAGPHRASGRRSCGQCDPPGQSRRASRGSSLDTIGRFEANACGGDGARRTETAGPRYRAAG